MKQGRQLRPETKQRSLLHMKLIWLSCIKSFLEGMITGDENVVHHCEFSQ